MCICRWWDDVSLYKDRRKSDTELLGVGCLLTDQYKMDEEEEVQTRWDKASLYNSTEGRLMMGSLWFRCGS